MDIVIIADFCGRFEGDSLKNRFYYLATLLSEENSVEIITSDFNHGTKTAFAEAPKHLPFTVTMLHEIGYSKNISPRRLVSHYKWGENIKAYLNKRKKPDVIYAAMPTLNAAKVAAEYCKKNNIRFIIDIQDQWPEAFQMVLNIPIVKDILFFPMKVLAEKAYRNADDVIAVSQTYVDRALIKNKKCHAGHAVFIGTNLETFDGFVQNCVPAVKKGGDDLWLGYCGSLSASYDIPCVLKAIKSLQDQGKVVPRFIVMGDGAREQEFKDLAKSLSVDATFTGKLPYDIMCATLKQCDIVVNPIAKGSAASIINKHGDYAASGLPVLNTQESPEYRALVEEYHMGLNCENGDVQDLAEKLEYLICHEDERAAMGANARRCAEEKFDRKHSYRTILACILSETNQEK